MTKEELLYGVQLLGKLLVTRHIADGMSGDEITNFETGPQDTKLLYIIYSEIEKQVPEDSF